MTAEGTVRSGELTARVIDAGSVLWAPSFDVAESSWRAEIPEADAQGRIRIALNGLQVVSPDWAAMVDPMSYQPDQAAEWEHADSLRCLPGLDGMSDAERERPVDVVVITHSDHDHFSGVVVRDGGRESLRYPAIPHVMNRADWEGNPDRDDPASLLSRRLGLVADHGLLRLIDGSVELLPGLRVDHRPGETPGHSVVWFDAARPIGYLGDLISHPAEVRHPQWIPPGRDVERMLVSREAVFEQAAASGALLTYSHAPAPYWGTIRRSGDGWEWAWEDADRRAARRARPPR
jgi:glyoxylase-like metal-dependent hydrolase (beta-lactamase superfamily II)